MLRKGQDLNELAKATLDLQRTFNLFSSCWWSSYSRNGKIWEKKKLRSKYLIIIIIIIIIIISGAPRERFARAWAEPHC